MKSLFAFLFVFASAAYGHEIKISNSMSDNSSMPFIERSSALALNVQYEDIKVLRNEISKVIKKPLKFLRSWEPEGEAHVTTITPPEFNSLLSKNISEETINQIAEKMQIQKSDIEILGIGSGKKKFGSEIGETFFVIVKSENLLKIRESIQKEYIKGGGSAEDFKALNFYPHITIGYTHEDIHEGDGLLKDVEHSLDKRFKLVREQP